MLADLQLFPELAQVFADLNALLQRELRLSVGKATKPHLDVLEEQLGRAMYFFLLDSLLQSKRSLSCSVCSALRSLSVTRGLEWKLR